MRSACFLAVLAVLHAGAALLPAADGVRPPPEAAASARMFESWKAPVPPRRLVANIHYVGAKNVSAFLLTTPEGHILIDTGFAETVPLIRRGVEQLGFEIGDIKFILSSHAHVDHTGGHAAMKRLTGAQVVASAADARLLESGGMDDFSPFPKLLMRYEAVKPDRIIRDGDTVTLGGTTLTAHLTPGHTRGATTWTATVRDGDAQHTVVFFSSVSIVGGTGLLTRPAYPEIVDDYRATFAKLKALPCDIWFSPHAEQFGLAGKLDRLDRDPTSNPFLDRDGWRKTIEAAERGFLDQLAAESAAPTK